MRGRSETNVIIYLLMPTILLTVVLDLYPLMSAISLSTTNLNLLDAQSGVFVGFANYYDFIHDPHAQTVFINTLYFTAGSVSVSFFLGLAMALCLNEDIKGARVFRAIAASPWIVPSVVAGLVWGMLYDPQIGIISYLLKATGIIRTSTSFLANPNLVLPSLIFVAVWAYSPLFVVILLAGLQGIPKDLYESAQIDGAGVVTRFFHITLPHLKSLAATAVLISIIWRFNHFDVVWVLTQGGPGFHSQVMSTYAYVQAFEFFNVGYGASIAVTATLIVLVFTILYLRRIGASW